MSSLIKLAAATTSGNPSSFTSQRTYPPGSERQPASPRTVKFKEEGESSRSQLLEYTAPPSSVPPLPLIPDISHNSKLKFVLSGLRSRYANSSGNLLSLFRHWDTDHSGSVDPQELTTALHGLGFTAVSEEDSRALIANIGGGGSSTVQYDEFVRLICPPKPTENNSLTASLGDLRMINVPTSHRELNLPGRVVFMGGRAVKKVLGPGEASALRVSSVGDAGNGVGADPLRESLARAEDVTDRTIRRSFYSDLGGRSSGQEEDGGGFSLQEEGESEGGRGRTTARREERVELASLPTVEQTSVLISKGILPAFNDAPPKNYDVTPPWVFPPDKGPDMNALIAAAHASNAAGREFDRRVRAGEVAMPQEGDAPPPGSISRAVLVTTKGLEDLATAPTHMNLPISPLAHTSRVSARRGVGAIPMSLPGGGDTAAALRAPGSMATTLTPSSTTNLNHPLSYLTTLGTSALAIPPALLQSVVVSGGVSTAATNSATTTTTTAVPFPNTLDRGLTASGRMPLRWEGVQGPFSSTESHYDMSCAVPDGGEDTVVVGNLASQQACRSVTASGGNHSLEPLSKGPFFMNSATRHLDKCVARVRLSTREVLDIPRAGEATMPNLFEPHLAPPPFSPLRGTKGQFGGGGDDSPRNARYESRRSAFLAARGGGAGSQVPPVAAAVETSTLGEQLSRGKSERLSRLEAVMGLSKHNVDSSGGHREQQQDQQDSAPVSGRTARLLEKAARHEGQRTTYLLSPPPSLRCESTPEHPSWNFATSARLAQTRTPIPEQAFKRLSTRDKFDNLRTTRAVYLQAMDEQHHNDFLFTSMDIASRIARKREERGAYVASISGRRHAQESMLSAPFPVKDVEL